MNSIKHLRWLHVVLLLTFILTGCDRYHIRRALGKIMESTIVLPAEVSMAFGGEIFPMPDSLRSVPKLIVYVDSSGCSMCRISKFGEYESLHKQSKETRLFDLVLMVAGGEMEGIPISRIISDMDFSFPVYVDEKCTFLKDNPSIPSDMRLHSLFVDGEGIPVFVGDPVYNSKITNLLSTYLKQLSSSHEN